MLENRSPSHGLTERHVSSLGHRLLPNSNTPPAGDSYESPRLVVSSCGRLKHAPQRTGGSPALGACPHTNPKQQRQPTTSYGAPTCPIAEQQGCQNRSATFFSHLASVTFQPRKIPTADRPSRQPRQSHPAPRNSFRCHKLSSSVEILRSIHFDPWKIAHLDRFSHDSVS